MKISSLAALVSILGIAYCDDSVSSYSVLPYEQNGIQHGGGYHAPSTGYGAPSTGYGAPSTGYGAPSTGYGAPSPYYGYENNNNKKGGDKMKKFFKKQMDNMRGYGKRMQNFFDDKKSKFLEFHGSLLRAKGSFLKSHGENMLRKAYQMKSKGNHYEPEYYYQAPSYNSYHAPSYVQHDTGYQAPSKGHDYNTKGRDNYHPKGHDSHHSKGHDKGKGFGHPKGKDIIHHPKGTETVYTSPTSQNYGDQPSHRRRISRQYSVSNVGPIPVPVSFHVQPAKLVLPNLSHGYH